MKAAEVMVADPHVAVAGAMASEVAIMLKTRNISVVPVVDDHRTRRFLGTLSDRDLVTRCLAEGQTSLAYPGRFLDADQLAGGAAGPGSSDGFEVRMDPNQPSPTSGRPSPLLDEAGRVVGFISHPEQIPAVKIVWG